MPPACLSLPIVLLVASALLCDGATFPSLPTTFGTEFELTLSSSWANKTYVGSEYFNAATNTSLLGRLEATGSMRNLLINKYSSTVLNWTESEKLCRSGAIPTTPIERMQLLTVSDFFSKIACTPQPENQTVVRGITADAWWCPSLRITQLDFVAVLTVHWYFSSSWTVMLSASSALLQISYSGNFTLGRAAQQSVSGEINIFSFSTKNFDNSVFSSPVWCTSTTTVPPTNVTTAAPATQSNPLPSLPSEFSVNIETTMLEKRTTFKLNEVFSSPLKLSRVTAMYNELQNNMRVSECLLVIGGFQIAFSIKNSTVPSGAGSQISSVARNAQFSNPSTCSKNVFTVELVGTTNELLLTTLASPARYLGRTTIRGIPAQYWETKLTDFTVTWYFAEQKWQFQQTTSSPLLRLVIVGRGKSPLFVHHPFYQRAASVPDAAREACKLFLGDQAGQCQDGESYFHHVHEFLGMVPLLDSTELSVPSACLQEGKVSLQTYEGPAGNGQMSGWTIFFIIVVMMVVTGVIVGLAVFYWMKRKQTLV